MFTLIKGGVVFEPGKTGKKDILLAGNIIAKIAENIELPASFNGKIIVAEDHYVVPGFIDLHVHIAGSGGETPIARTPEITVSKIFQNGVTTVVGCMGLDNITRSLENLLAKAVQLEEEGLSTFIYTGSYQVPVNTITGSISKDIALIPKIIGVGELAISDHRSSQPTYEELCRLSAEARVGGMIGGKKGLIHLHVGDGSPGLDPIIRIIRETEIPVHQFLPTHVNRSKKLLNKAFEFARAGGNIDMTAEHPNLDFMLPVSEVIPEALENGVNLEQLTISSDSNGSMPVFDDQGRLTKLILGDMNNLYKQWIKLVTSDFPLQNALKLITENPAKRTGIFSKKGSLETGKDADLVILCDDLRIQTVIAKGKVAVLNGEIIMKGTFES